MEGQVVLQVARLLRLGPSVNQAELNRVLGGLTPVERSSVLRAARSVNTATRSVQRAQGNVTLRSLFAGAGWDVGREGSSPTGDDSIHGKVTVKIITPDGTVKWRTIVDDFPPGATVDEMLSQFAGIGEDWGKKYPGSTWEIIVSSLTIY